MILNDDFTSVLPEGILEYVEKTLSRVTSFKSEDFLIGELFKPSTHLLNNNGKLLRPTLLFLSAYAMDEPCGDLVDLAAAIELLHVSSLIHDDIIDSGKTRRGTDTVNAKYGSNVALLAGNALISKAIHLSSKYGKGVIDAVSSTALQMTAGELVDYGSKLNGNKMGIENYVEIASLKTASLTGTASSIVAVYKKSDSVNALHNYGFNLGMAFQIRDDILDFSEQDSKKGSLNIVSLMMENGMDKDKAIVAASELNHSYIDNAINGLPESKSGKILGKYARMIKAEPS